MIVIACNTASSVAYETIKNECQDIEIVNVIDPIVKRITNNINTKTIGVIGTKGTINSNVYPQKIKSINQNISVKSLATPCFGCYDRRKAFLTIKLAKLLFIIT